MLDSVLVLLELVRLRVRGFRPFNSLAFYKTPVSPDHPFISLYLAFRTLFSVSQTGPSIFPVKRVFRTSLNFRSTHSSVPVIAGRYFYFRRHRVQVLISLVSKTTLAWKIFRPRAIRLYSNFCILLFISNGSPMARFHWRLLRAFRTCLLFQIKAALRDCTERGMKLQYGCTWTRRNSVHSRLNYKQKNGIV